MKACRHYYKWVHPTTGKVKEVWYERMITEPAEKKLRDAGFELVEEYYICPVFYRMLKEIAEYNA